MSAARAALHRGRSADRPLDWPARLEPWLLVAAGLLLFSAGLGLRDPWPADEPRFALIARDMLHSGQWLFPQVGGELYADKPPLSMWLTAGCYALTGELRIAFLLPSLLAGLGMLALVHDLGRRLWNRRVAMVAGLLLLASLQFTLQARSAQLDALLALWTTLGLYGLLRHLLLGPDWRWYAAGGLAMGLGVITKGVGFLPLLVLLPWGWLRWRRAAALPRIAGRWWQWALAPAALLMPIAAWLVPMLVAVRLSADPALAAYRDELLFHQTATRYADAWTHLRPAWYYVVEVIPWLWFPATLALPWLLPAWRRRLLRGDARYALLLGHVAGVVLFFSLSPGKRDVYLLPALPAFALACAPLLAAGLLRRPALRRLALGAIALAGLAALGAAAILTLDLADLSARATFRGLAVRDLVALLAIAGIAAVLAGSWGWLVRREPEALALLLAAGWLGFGWFGHPALTDARSGADLMARVATLVPAREPLALAGWKEQLLLHADRPVVHFGFRREPGAELADAIAWLAVEPNGRLLIPAQQARSCFELDRARPVAYRHRRQWLLVDGTALNGACAGEVGRGPRRYDPALGTATAVATKRSGPPGSTAPKG